MIKIDPSNLLKILKLSPSILLLFVSLFCSSQSIEAPFFFKKDSLKFKTYDELYYSFYYNMDNPTLYSVYAEQYLIKAYQEKDTFHIAKGYYMITLEEKEKYNKYHDSLIKYAPMVKSDYWLWMGHFGKGSFLYRKRDFKSSFISHIKAFNIATKLDNEELIDISRISIGLLKERIGQNKEALDDFRKSYEFVKKNILNKSLDSLTIDKTKSFLNTMTLLSNSYRLNNKLDSATYIDNKVQTFRFLKGSKEYINKTRLNAAEVHFIKQEFNIAIDSLNIAMPIFGEFEDERNLAVCSYLRGISFLKTDEEKKAIKDLIKMDSLFNVIGDLYPTLRPGYEVLINHYKTNKNTTKQLYYVEQLLRFDSIVHENYAYIREGIIEKLDKPLLLKEKNDLKDKLSNSRKKIYYWATFGFVILIASLLEILRRKKSNELEKEKLKLYYEEKFDNLIKQYRSEDVQQKITIHYDKKQELGIAENVVESILSYLDDFENNLKFTDPKITATSLAKKMGTNANYLGRVIKYKHEKSFRNYLNDLRIEYALKRLRNDQSFKKFSVLAIAIEVGFKNSEPFSKAFKNNLGLFPSEFISQLEE